MFSLLQKFPETLAFIEGRANVKFLFRLNLNMGSRLAIFERTDGYFHVVDTVERTPETTTLAMITISENLLYQFFSTRVPFRKLLETVGINCFPFVMIVTVDANDHKKVHNIKEVVMSAFLRENVLCGEARFVGLDCDRSDQLSINKWCTQYRNKTKVVK